jgi:hypothetical protein
MLRCLLVILLVGTGFSFAQEVPDKAEDALIAYVDLREDYKHSSTKQFSKTEQLALDDWCYAIQKKFPDSYESYFAWYLNDHFKDDAQEDLFKAYAKSSKEKEVVKAMFAHYMKVEDYTKAKSLLSAVSVYYSANTLAYYKDAIPASGGIFVSGNTDAIPCYINQLKAGTQEDVLVINMDFLINDTYRQRMSSYLSCSSILFFGNEVEYVKKAMNQNSKIHLSATVSQNYIGANEANVFNTGLTYQSQPASQIVELEAFWNRVAKKNFSNMSLTYLEMKLYTNYLPPLLTLYHLQLLRGSKNEVLRKAILILAEKVAQTKKVTTILNDYE